MKPQFPKQVVPPPNVIGNPQTTNLTPPKRPNKTTAPEYQAQQMVKGRSTAAKIRAQASVVSSSTNRRTSMSQQHGNAGPSSIDGLSQGIRQIQLEADEHEVESVGSHSTASGIDEDDLKCLVDNTIKRMKDQLQTINAGSDPKESIKELAEILVDLHPAAQPQVVESFVNALAPKTSEQTESVLAENELTYLITLLEQELVPNSATLDNDSDNDSNLQKSIAGIAQGILDGIATTLDLDDKTSAQLVEAVSNWCTDPAKVPDEDVLAVHQRAGRILKMLFPEFCNSDDENIQKFIQSLNCIGNVCYVRTIDAALDDIPDDKLPAITQKLQNCEKWFVNQDSPGHKLHETFTKLIDRIDERQSSIAKIPEIGHEGESVDSHSTASGIDEEDLKRLVDDTIKRMKDQLQTINAGSDPKESIKELAEILVDLHPAAQPQVVESFVNALAPKTSEQTESVLAENELTYLITLLDNDSEKSIAGIAQGILDGIATTPDLDDKTSAQLVEAVLNWCTDRAKVPDEDVSAVHHGADTIRNMKMLSPEFGNSDDESIQKFIQSLNCIGNVCYVRRVDAVLDDIPDGKLPAVTQKLRHCAKWFFNQDSPGHKLHETFTKLIDRIDERQPSIGKIPEIGHVVWVGKPISEENIENLLNFLRLNKDYETTIIATDRPQETQRVINQVIDRLSEQSPGFENLRTKVKPCHYEEWLPADNEMIGDVSGAEIRALVETLRSGYGNVYPAASDILRLLGLRSEKTVNGETTKGGLYFDADLQWHQPMPSLSSPLGITLNVKPGDINESGDINNNVLGVPSDTEVIDKFIQYIVHGYRDRNIETAMKEVDESYPNLAARIAEMNEEYAKTNAENKQLHHTEHDPMFEFNKELTKGEKQKIREENRMRAQEILAQVHPAQNKVDYSRFRHAMAEDHNEIVNSRFALTLALSGPMGLRTFLQNMFSVDYDKHERFSQLGRIGRMHTDGARTDEVYTEVSDAPWAKASNFENNDPSNPRRSRRATIGGTTTLGELEKAPTGLFSDQYGKQYKNQSGKSDSNS